MGVGIAAPCRCLLASEVCVFNDIHYPLMSKRSECGSFLWVCLLWSVGASDVVSVSVCGQCVGVGYRGRSGPLPMFTV